MQGRYRHVQGPTNRAVPLGVAQTHPGRKSAAKIDPPPEVLTKLLAGTLAMLIFGSHWQSQSSYHKLEVHPKLA
jgi:hypothetical protein